MTDKAGDSGILSDFIDEPTLAVEVKVTPRTLARYRNMPDGLPYAMIGGKVMYRRQLARDWFLRRIIHPNSTTRRRRGS